MSVEPAQNRLFNPMAERLEEVVATYNSLRRDQMIRPEELGELKMQIGEIVNSMDAPDRRDDDRTRIVYEEALNILTQENVAEPVPMRKRALSIITKSGNDLTNRICRFFNNHKTLGYVGAGIAMGYIAGFPGVIMAATIYAADKIQEDQNRQAAAIFRI